MPVFNNPEAIGDTVDDQEETGTFETRFRSDVCDQLSAGGDSTGAHEEQLEALKAVMGLGEAAAA